MQRAKTSGMIIFGSSRSHGNTYQISKMTADETGFDLLDLNQFEISAYDYDHRNREDDFLDLAERMIQCDTLILATPVYWYSMSAQMKIFLDRWSDLVTIRKDLGRALASVKLMTVSCSNDNEPGEGIELPFRQTAGYMDMKYKGHFHIWKEEGKEIGLESGKVLRALVDQVS